MSCKDLNSDVNFGGSKDEKKEAASARLENLMGHGRFQLFQVWVFGALVRISCTHFGQCCLGQIHHHTTNSFCACRFTLILLVYGADNKM
jgi:hypothetical protein